MNCPRCKTERLTPEILEGVEIDTCPKCRGSWLDDGELGKIVKTEEMTFSPEQIKECLCATFDGIPKNEPQGALNCPVCESVMRTINYGAESGIIIDRCTNNDGVWLDFDEVNKSQIFMEHADDDLQYNAKIWGNHVVEVARFQEKENDIKKKAAPPSKHVVESLLRELQKRRQ